MPWKERSIGGKKINLSTCLAGQAVGIKEVDDGITEAFHNKMELINRQAYGFRNFETTGKE